MKMMRVNIRLSPHIDPAEKMQTYPGCGLKLFRDQFPETLSLSRLCRKGVSHLACCQRRKGFSPRLGFGRPEPFPSLKAANVASLWTGNSLVRRFRQHELYFVYLGRGNYNGKDATTDDFDPAINSHHEIMESILESKEKANQAIIHSYTNHINGFDAYLDEEEATRISKHPDVITVFRKSKRLHTTRSRDFLGLGRNGFVPPSSIWTKANYGKDVIIAHLDTGVWPESASFRDDGLGQIPAKWKGSCENSTKNGVVCNRSLPGTISAGKTAIGVKPAPAMASFSSRGPNFKAHQLLKPDITAPGVDILASFTKAAPVSESTYNTRRWPFNLLSGTSMACPHVAGIIGLLRKLYPDWSPAAIRSAIMTTARTRDNTGVPMKDEDTGCNNEG